MQRFDFKAGWVPGKTKIDADVLSRAPVDQPKPEDELAEAPPSNKVQQAVISVLEGSAAAVVDPVLDRIGQAAKVDATKVALRDTILHDFPNAKCTLPPNLKPYWAARHQLAIDDCDDLVVVGARVIIPEACRKKILQDLAIMHQEPRALSAGAFEHILAGHGPRY